MSLSVISALLIVFIPTSSATSHPAIFANFSSFILQFTSLLQTYISPQFNAQFKLYKKLSSPKFCIDFTIGVSFTSLRSISVFVVKFNSKSYNFFTLSFNPLISPFSISLICSSASAGFSLRYFSFYSAKNSFLRSKVFFGLSFNYKVSNLLTVSVFNFKYFKLGSLNWENTLRKLIISSMTHFVWGKNLPSSSSVLPPSQMSRKKSRT